MQRLKIVLGLGNPGARYGATRHNLGFRVVDRLAERGGASFEIVAELSGEAWIAEVSRGSGTLVLAKPRTYMNHSGRAGVALCRHYTALPSQLLVVYDDADLELGRLRIRPSGHAGGHNGLSSLIESLQSEEIPRVRLGVCGDKRGRVELADYVLAPFEENETEVADTMVKLAVEAVDVITSEGLTTAMNRYNARSASLTGPAASDEKE